MTGGRIKFRIPKLPAGSYMTVKVTAPTTSLLLKYLPNGRYFPLLVGGKNSGELFVTCQFLAYWLSTCELRDLRNVFASKFNSGFFPCT